MLCRVHVDPLTNEARLVANRRIKAGEEILAETSTLYELYSGSILSITSDMINPRISNVLPPWLVQYYAERGSCHLWRTAMTSIEGNGLRPLTYHDYLVAEFVRPEHRDYLTDHKAFFGPDPIPVLKEVIERSRLSKATVEVLKNRCKGSHAEALRVTAVLFQKALPISEHVLTSITFGTAIFNVGGQCRYSCKPNALWTTVPLQGDTGPTIRMRACVDIEEGDEILICRANTGNGIVPTAQPGTPIRCDIRCTVCKRPVIYGDLEHLSDVDAIYCGMKGDSKRDAGLNSSFLNLYRIKESHQKFKKHPWLKTRFVYENAFGRWTPRPYETYRAPRQFFEEEEIKDVCDHFETLVLRMSPGARDVFELHRRHRDKKYAVPRHEALESLRDDMDFLRRHSPCRYAMCRAYVAYHATETMRWARTEIVDKTKKSEARETVRGLRSVLLETDPYGANYYVLYETLCGWAELDHELKTELEGETPSSKKKKAKRHRRK